MRRADAEKEPRDLLGALDRSAGGDDVPAAVTDEGHGRVQKLDEPVQVALAAGGHERFSVA